MKQTSKQLPTATPPAQRMGYLTPRVATWYHLTESIFGKGLPRWRLKNLPANARDLKDVGLILGLGRYPGGGNDNPFQCSCWENPMDRGAWWATVYEVTETQTRPSISPHFH